jgi:hypothetical protein
MEQTDQIPCLVLSHQLVEVVVQDIEQLLQIQQILVDQAVAVQPAMERNLLVVLEPLVKDMPAEMEEVVQVLLIMQAVVVVPAPWEHQQHLLVLAVTVAPELHLQLLVHL